MQLTTSRLAVMLGIICLVPALAACDAAEQRAGMMVRRGGDLVGSGGTLRVTDSVPGDVMLAGSELDFSGAVGGDYLGAGGDQRIGGRVHGSVRAASGNVIVASVIDRNATIAGGNVELREAGVIQGNAYLVGGNIVVEGAIRQLLRASAGSIEIDGSVGDVNVTAGTLRVGPRARIDGDLRYRVPVENVRIDSAATITGQVIALPTRSWSTGWLVVRLLWALGFLLAGAVLVALLPAIAAAASDGLRTRPGVSVGLGIMWLVLLPIAIALVMATVIGLPLGMVLLATYLVVLYLAGIVAALAIGRLILRDWERSGRGRLVAAFLLGGIALMAVGWIPVVGGVLVLLAVVLGAGALLIPVVRRRVV